MADSDHVSNTQSPSVCFDIQGPCLCTCSMRDVVWASELYCHSRVILILVFLYATLHFYPVAALRQVNRVQQTVTTFDSHIIADLQKPAVEYQRRNDIHSKAESKTNKPFPVPIYVQNSPLEVALAQSPLNPLNIPAPLKSRCRGCGG